VRVRSRQAGVRALHAFLVLAIAAPCSGQARDSVSVTFRPWHVLEGTLAEVALRGSSDSGDSVAGVVAGEPLHFEWYQDQRVWWALMPVPLGSSDSLDVALIVRRAADPSDTLAERLAVRPRHEALQVLHLPAPYNRPPDSAAVVRLGADAARLDTIWREAHGIPRLWHEPFLRPVPGRVTTVFGEGREIDGMSEPRHQGVDLAGAKGSVVHAANRGIVAAVTSLYESGLTVILDHGAGLVTAYGHLSEATVAVGDTVARGQVLGHVGVSGRVTGPHLHWAAFYGALAVDPLSLLDIRSVP